LHKKVLCPVERPDNKTSWLRAGNAFDNKDGSINVYLDVLPSNGRLQIRDFDERDRARIENNPDEKDVTGNLPF